MSVPHVQRCTEVRLFGAGQHRRRWQCLISPAPHPDVPCWFGVDAEVYGRALDDQRPEWLAAQLRDAQALLRNRQRRIDELTAIAVDLADSYESGSPVRRTTSEWLRATAPTAAAKLDEKWGGRWWQS